MTGNENYSCVFNNYIWSPPHDLPTVSSKLKTLSFPRFWEIPIKPAGFQGSKILNWAIHARDDITIMQKNIQEQESNGVLSLLS